MTAPPDDTASGTQGADDPPRTVDVRPRSARVRLGPLCRAGLGGVLGLALAAAVLVCVCAWAALYTERGTRVLLEGAQRLTGDRLLITEPGGVLMGGFGARSLQWRAADGRVQFEVQGLRWQGLRIHRASQADWQLGIRLRSLEAAGLRVAAAEASDDPVTLPVDLALPVAVEVDELKIGRMDLPGLDGRPLRNLTARQLALHAVPGGPPPAAGSARGPEHRLADLQLSWDRMRLVAAARVGVHRPFGLQARVEAHATAVAGPDLQAVLHAQGTLERVQVSMQASARVPSTGAASPPPARPSPAPGPQLQAQAELQPFAAMPLTRLDLRAERLDLQAWFSAAPQTLLAGRVDLRPASRPPTVAPAGQSPPAPAGAEEPSWRLEAALRNDGAGLWSDRRLPVHAADVLVWVGGWEAGWGRVDALRLQLGSLQRPAGRLDVQGRWRRACPTESSAASEAPSGASGGAACTAAAGSRWQGTASASEVWPARLDARAPGMRISGPVELQAASEALSVWPLRLHARLEGRVVPPEPGQAGPAAANLATVVRPGTSVQLQARARLAVEALELSQFQIRAGPTAAQASGQARWEAGRWQAGGELKLERFDPGLWWPGWLSAGAAAASGSTELNAAANFELAGLVPASGSWLQDGGRGLIGQARLALAPSRLLGLSASGEGTVRSSGKGDAAATFQGQADLAGNRLSWEGRGALPGSPAPAARADAWTLQVDAPALDRLAPLLAAWGWQDLRGRLQAQVQADGRWPDLRTRGRLQAEGLALRPADSAVRWTLGQADGEWDVGPVWRDPQASLAANVELAALSLGNLQVARLQARSSGSGEAHRLQAQAQAELQWAPTAAGAGRAAAASGRTVRQPVPVRLDVSGGGQLRVGEAAPDSRRWRVQIDRLELAGAAAPRAASVPVVPAIQAARAVPPRAAPAAEPGASSAAATLQRAADLTRLPWLSAEGLQWSWEHGPGGWTLQMDPARIQSLGARLQVQRLHWRHAASGEADELDLQAELEPFAVAPVLAWWQPEAGWGGDLTVGGRLRWQQVRGDATGVSLQAELGRRAGDLTLADTDVEGGALQRLRLTELSLAAQASGGTWRFSQRAVGRNLGTLAARQTVQAAPHDLWPGPQAPLAGELQLQIANLRAWGSWLPAGWRLGGQLEGAFALGGQLGAPEYTGSLRGRELSARNLLEGVDLQAGELDLRLHGPSARIERFVIRAGEGELTATGSATFGAVPAADLRVQASRFAAIQRIDRQVVVSGDARLTMEPERLGLEGRVALDRGRVDISRLDAPSLGDDVVVLRAEDDEPQPPANGQIAGRRVDLRLQIDLADRLHLIGRGLDAMLGGELLLTSPGGRLAANGTIRTVSGTYAAYGQKLSIDRGSIAFGGPIGNPRLDIQATRKHAPSAVTSVGGAVGSSDDVRVGVIITGTGQAPRVRLYSDPAMSDTDKLSWLVLGRGSSGLGRNDAALLQSAAAALLAGEGDGPGDWVQSIGLDELSVRQGDGDVRDTIVAIGKQVSRRWYVGYERGLNATAGTWQLIYRLGQRFTVRAQSGLDDSLDLIWSWRWR